MEDPGASLSCFDDAWSAVQGVMAMLMDYALSDVIVQPTPKELSTCYAAVYDICSHSRPFTDQVYKRFGHTIDDMLKANVAPRLRRVPGIDLLVATIDLWDRFVRLRGWFKTIFAYVDRYYCEALRMLPLDIVGTNSFRLLVLEPAMPRIRKAMDERISALRSGPFLKDDVVSRIEEVMVLSAHGDLFFYQREFEESFVKRSKAYYQTLRLQLFETHGETDLSTQVSLALSREEEVLDAVLRPESAQKANLMTACKAALNS